MKRIQLILLITSIFAANISLSQEDTLKENPVIMLIIKNDGGRYTGPILSDDGREILIDSKEIGKLYIAKHLIKSIEPLSESNNNSTPANNNQNPPITYYPTEIERLHSTKYIQTDNAYPLKRDGAFIKFMPVGVEGQFPLTKNWSMGVVSSYLGAPFALKSKYSFEVDKNKYVAIDVIYGSMIFGGIYGSDITDGGAAAMVTYTFGNRTTNFTVRGGYALIHQTPQWGQWDPVTGQWNEGNNNIRYDNNVVTGFAGMVKVNDRVDCVFDVLLAAGSNGIYGAAAVAARYGRKPQHRYQLGLGVFGSSNSFIPVPVPSISYTYIFNKRNVEKNF